MLNFYPSLARTVTVALAALAFTAVGCTASSDPSPEEGASEEAFTGVTDVPSDFPSESGWALSQIRTACQLTSGSLAGATGTIERTGDGVVYRATQGGNVVASAWAKSTFVFASKRCLTK